MDKPQALKSGGSRILDPSTIPLIGRHLIEASAGTGKTFNITRIYIRLLLERELSVQQILIMTFTEAATDEIRGRVAEYIDEVIAQWEAPNDSLLISIQSRVDKKRGAQLLQIARLEIDDASIFTIHGFCQRLLSQYASSFKYNVDAAIQVNTDKYFLQAITDALLILRRNGDLFSKLEDASLHTPDAFYKKFYAVFHKNTELRIVDIADTAKELVELVNQKWQHAEAQRVELAKYFAAHKADFYLGLADKPDNKLKVDAEIEQVIDWLHTSKPSASNANVGVNEELEDTLIEALKKENETQVNKVFVNGKFSLLTSTRKKKYNAEFASELVLACRAINDIFTSAYRVNGNKIVNGLATVDLFKTIVPYLLSIKQKVISTLDTQALISFDQMIYKVADGLSPKASQSNKLINKIKHKYPVALVDEFQDTDSSQYAILSSLYGNKNDVNDLALSALYMIGDPKQAIYGFRGGDVFTYLSAKYDADYLWSMGTNWRSTKAMVDAYNALFSAKDLSSKFMFDIDYSPVAASDNAKAASMSLFDTRTQKMTSTALHFGIAEAKEVANRKEQELPQYLSIIYWMIDEIIDLLQHHEFRPANDKLQPTHNVNDGKVKPKDIAILVRTGHEARMIRRELTKAGLKSVYLSERTSLFQSIQATQLYYVLDAINTLNDISKTRAAIATGILLPQLYNIDINAIIEDDEHIHWQDVFKLIAGYKRSWLQTGIFALLNKLIRENVEPTLDAERALTNFNHLAEELGGIAVIQQTPKSQLFWLQSQIQDSNNTASEIRLESDQALIKIITQHKSKGLEYPIVFVPFANASSPTPSIDTIVFHTETNRLTTQLGYSHSAYQQAEKEDAAERMRLLYVAVTRAVYRCYLGMLCAKGSENSALNKATGLNKHARFSGEYTVSKCSASNQSLDGGNAAEYRQAMKDSIQSELSSAIDVVGIEFILAKGGRLMASEEAIPALSCNKVNISINDIWRLNSFSSLLRDYGVKHISQPTYLTLSKPAVATIERDEENDAIESTLHRVSTFERVDLTDTDIDTPLRFALKPGAEAGNLLHDLLEFTDFTTAKFDDAWQNIAHKYAWFDVADFDALVTWLSTCLQARILNEGLCLQNLSLHQTLREANFYFPLDDVSISALRNVVVEHRNLLNNKNCNQRNVEPITEDTLVGMMQGFIDLVFEYNGKYYLVDYKSSYLGDSESDYGVSSLLQHVQEHHYDLQYHIYALALHRMLGQKIENYQYDAHFGGVLYLYLRGMSNEATPEVSQGVFKVAADEIDICALEAVFKGNKCE